MRDFLYSGVAICDDVWLDGVHEEQGPTSQPNHGSGGGWSPSLKHKEEESEMAPASDADRAKAYRDRKRGKPPREPAAHGTLAAYRRHQRAQEAPCEACRAAWAEAQRRYYQKRKQA